MAIKFAFVGSPDERDDEGHIDGGEDDVRDEYGKVDRARPIAVWIGYGADLAVVYEVRD